MGICKHQNQSGQGAILVVGVVVLLGLLIGSMSLSQLAKVNAERNVATKTSMQTHYVAMAGIQEAIATRLMPRTNYQALNQQPINGQGPLFPNSGRVYQNPPVNTNLMGVYRYIILGGDPARQDAGGGPYYGTGACPGAWCDPTSGVNWHVSGTHPSASSFYIVSYGRICMSKAQLGSVDINSLVNPQINAPGNPGFPTMLPNCTGGAVPDDLVLVARVRSADPSLGNTNAIKIDNLRVFKNPTAVRIGPNGAYVPGVGWVNGNGTFDFETAYAANDQTNGRHPAELRRVVFYDYATNAIFGGPTDIPGANATRPAAQCIPINAAIRLYFNGPVDYRSVAADVSTCSANPALCNITLQAINPASPLPVTNFTYLPGVPSFTNYILWPQYGGSMTGGPGTLYRLTVRNMTSFNGSVYATPKTVDFTAC